MSKGFTLIELLAYLILAGIIYTGVISLMGDSRKFGDIQAAKAKATAIDLAKSSYIADVGTIAYDNWTGTDYDKFKLLYKYMIRTTVAGDTEEIWIKRWNTFAKENPKNFTYTIGALDEKTTFSH